RGARQHGALPRRASAPRRRAPPGRPLDRLHQLGGGGATPRSGAPGPARGQSNAKPVTIHRALGGAGCPLAVTTTPFATPTTATVGATHRRRPSIRSRRRTGSQVVIDPVMRNCGGVEAITEV